jgi:predicted nucleotidyltransferase
LCTGPKGGTQTHQPERADKEAGHTLIGAGATRLPHSPSTTNRGTISPMKRAVVLQSTKDIISALTQILADPRFAAINLAILYGSAARDTLRRDSDIDLAVCAGPRTPLDDDTLLDLVRSCEAVTGRETQLRDLSRAHGVFLKEVLTTGVVIHQTDPRVRGELIIDMLDFVEDLLPIVRTIRSRKREHYLAG